MTGVRKAFGATMALDAVNLSVNAGEVHALIGENGAGKSTLMKVLSGALRPDAGSISLDGVAYQPGNPVAGRRAGVAMIYQELTIAGDLTVADNICLGAWPARFGWIQGRQRNAIAARALADVGADLPLQGRAGDLTNGQQQLLEIARALAGSPRVLVLDEPTSSLTRSDVEQLFRVVRTLAARGVAIIYISHFLEEIQTVCDRYTVLRDGCSVATGTVADTTPDALIRAMVGRDVSEIYPRIPHASGPDLLELTGVTGRTLPHRVNAVVQQGEIVGLFGLIGAGRTETARCLFGLDPVTQGRIRIHGTDTTHLSPARMLARGVGLLSENRKEEGLLLGQSLADNLTLTRLGPYTVASLVSARKQQAATRDWMERLGVKAAGPAQSVGELSGGNQQKIALGRLLHHDCRLLILDEPTRGVDIGAKATIYQLIGELAAQGKTIVIISSYIPELLGICDRVAAMCRGELGPLRNVTEWTEASLLAAAIGQDAPASAPASLPTDL